MNLYQLRVSLPGLRGVYRIIEATQNCTFEDLHHVVFEAFDRYEEHLYSFFITKKETQSLRKVYDAPEITHPMHVENSLGWDEPKQSAAKTTLHDAGLNERDVFYYLFDFGDDWWHRIRVEAIRTCDKKRRSIKITKSVGDSPPQYEAYDEEEEYDDDE